MSIRNHFAKFEVAFTPQDFEALCNAEDCARQLCLELTKLLPETKTAAVVDMINEADNLRIKLNDLYDTYQRMMRWRSGNDNILG